MTDQDISIAMAEIVVKTEIVAMIEFVAKTEMVVTTEIVDMIEIVIEDLEMVTTEMERAQEATNAVHQQWLHKSQP